MGRLSDLLWGGVDGAGVLDMRICKKKIKCLKRGFKNILPKKLVKKHNLALPQNLVKLESAYVSI